MRMDTLTERGTNHGRIMNMDRTVVTPCGLRAGAGVMSNHGRSKGEDMAYGYGQGNGGARPRAGQGNAGGGNRWPSFTIDPAAVHPFTRNAKDGRQFDMMVVSLPAGTTVDGRDLTGFAISVFQGKYTQEQLQQGRDVYVGLNPARQVEVFKGKWNTPEYQRVEVAPQALADAVNQAKEATGPSAGMAAPQAGGPRRVGFAGRRDENGVLVRDDGKMRESQASGRAGAWSGARRPRPQFTIGNEAVHPFQRTARNGNTYDMIIVNLPAGTTVDGRDLTGFSFSAFQNDLNRQQLANHEPVTVSLTAGRAVDLFRGRRSDPDYATYGVQDPETLVQAIKSALDAAGQDAGQGQPAQVQSPSDGAAAPWAGAAQFASADGRNPWAASVPAPSPNPWGSVPPSPSTQGGTPQGGNPWAGYAAGGAAPSAPWQTPQGGGAAPVSAADEASYDSYNEEDGYADEFDEGANGDPF